MSNLIPDFNRNVHCLLGLPFDAVGLDQASAQITLAAVNKTLCFFSTPNLNFLVATQTDVDFRQSVINSDLSVADGMPIVWMARLLGIPIRERVAGSDLFETIRYGTGEKISVFFFGGPEGIAEAASRKINAENGRLRCVGYMSPGFGSVQEISTPETINQINQSGADLLVVSLGACKGQSWIEHNRSALKVPVVSHLGAVVNFVAGSVMRAPTWMQKTGLEWLWRVKAEPNLWKRYINDGMALVKLLFANVLPQVFYQWRLVNTLKLAETESVSLTMSQNHTQIELRGNWTLANLEPVRRIFFQATAAGLDVRIDVSRVQMFDSAFLGLVLLLYGHQIRTNRLLTLQSVSGSQSRQIQRCGAGYLLDM